MTRTKAPNAYVPQRISTIFRLECTCQNARQLSGNRVHWTQIQISSLPGHPKTVAPNGGPVRTDGACGGIRPHNTMPAQLQTDHGQNRIAGKGLIILTLWKTPKIRKRDTSKRPKNRPIHCRVM